jgi:hypothetical protein
MNQQTIDDVCMIARKAIDQIIQLERKLYGPTTKNARGEMSCPKCQGKTKIYRTFDAVRQRLCLGCGFKFVTEEVVRPDGKVPFK